jgi:hypothetical protein
VHLLFGVMYTALQQQNQQQQQQGAQLWVTPSSSTRLMVYSTNN